MKDESRRLALLNDLFSGGGVERMLSYMSGGLLKSGGQVFLFDASKIDFDYAGEIVSLEIKRPPYSGIFEEAWQLWRALIRLRGAKKRYRVDVCISHKEGPNFINVLSGRSRAICTVHELKSSGIKYRGWKLWLVRQIIRRMYNRADFVVAVSKQIAVDLEVNFGVDARRLRTIYNPCDVAMVSRRRAEPLKPEHEALFDGPTVVTVGRLDRQKGHWHLIRGFTEVRRQVPNARLLILGDGDHRVYLQRIIGELGLGDAVHLMGYQGNPFQFMGRANLFVLSSLWEGFPAILLEAMACGLPVISTDCPSGPRELLAPESDDSTHCTDILPTRYGLLTPRVEDRYPASSEGLSTSESQLAAAIARLLQDEAARNEYAHNGEQRVRDFSLDDYIARWRALIDEA